MIFNEHSGLKGKHSFLSPSKYHWLNYSDEKLDEAFRNSQAAARGTELHAFAHHAIRLGIKLPRTEKTLNMYVNDAIGYRMTTEQLLYFSENCYGTTDTISFRNRLLRIHDLKTGIISGSVHQLEIYVGIFCHEYGYKPGDIETELRIYQNDEIEVFLPDTDTIAHVMSKIASFDRRIELLKAER